MDFHVIERLSFMAIWTECDKVIQIVHQFGSGTLWFNVIYFQDFWIAVETTFLTNVSISLTNEPHQIILASSVPISVPTTSSCESTFNPHLICPAPRLVAA